VGAKVRDLQGKSSRWLSAIRVESGRFRADSAANWHQCQLHGRLRAVWVTGDKARVELESAELVTVTLGPRASPDEASEHNGDGWWVTYDDGEREGLGGFARDHELKPAP
jgi:hypothetical protein